MRRRSRSIVPGSLIPDIAAKAPSIPHSPEVARPKHPHHLRLQVVGRAFDNDASVIHQRDAVGKMVGLFEVLGSEEDGRAVGNQMLDRLPDVGPRPRIEAGSRFVKDENRGFAIRLAARSRRRRMPPE